MTNAALEKNMTPTKALLTPLSLTLLAAALWFLAAPAVWAAPAANPPAAQEQSDAAAAATPFATYSLSNPIKAGTAPELIGRFVSMFIGVVGSFALLMFIYGGLMLLTSRGNAEQVQKGKNIFIWAVIGLVVIFSAYIVLRNVFQIIGATD